MNLSTRRHDTADQGVILLCQHGPDIKYLGALPGAREAMVQMIDCLYLPDFGTEGLTGDTNYDLRRDYNFVAQKLSRDAAYQYYIGSAQVGAAGKAPATGYAFENLLYTTGQPELYPVGTRFLCRVTLPFAERVPHGFAQAEVTAIVFERGEKTYRLRLYIVGQPVAMRLVHYGNMPTFVMDHLQVLDDAIPRDLDSRSPQAAPEGVVPGDLDGVPLGMYTNVGDEKLAQALAGALALFPTRPDEAIGGFIGDLADMFQEGFREVADSAVGDAVYQTAAYFIGGGTSQANRFYRAARNSGAR